MLLKYSDIDLLSERNLKSDLIGNTDCFEQIDTRLIRHSF